MERPRRWTLLELLDNVAQALRHPLRFLDWLVVRYLTLGVDTRATSEGMAPDAPAPTYDRDGNLALGWLVVVRYDPSKGAVVLSWNKDGDLYRQTKQGAVAFPLNCEDEVEDALVDTVRMLTAPQLL